MSLPIRTVAVRFSAAPVSLGQRTRQSVWRNPETPEQGVLALTQASGRISFSRIPLHLTALLHTEPPVSNLSSRPGNLRNPTPKRSSASSWDYGAGAEPLKVTVSELPTFLSRQESAAASKGGR